MKYFSTLILILIATITYSQKIIVDAKPSSATLYLESVPTKNPKQVKIKTLSMGILAVMDGYATNGITFRDLQKEKSESYTINMNKVSPMESGYVSKSIEFKDIDDETGKVEKPDRMTLYGINVKGTALNTPLFVNVICESMSDYGYDVINSTGKFEDTEDKASKPEIYISANLKYFSKDTRGDGFQVSIIVEWTIYSVSDKKIVAKIQTGGYSDTAEAKFNNELSSAFGDATIGLTVSPEFQKFAKK
jgi:uncharacterized protein YsxB (DUF464 family)